MEQLASVAGPVGVVLWIGLTVLFIAAWVQIVTKAGYSAWWVLIPVSAAVLWLIALVLGANAFVNSLRSLHLPGSGDVIASPASLNSTGLDVAGVLAVIAIILFVVSWILFYVFAFSRWPVLGQPTNRGHSSPGGRPPAPVLSSPGPATAPGWYPLGATNNDQAYWDGESWTARKKWEGAGWVDVPLTGAHPTV